MISLRQIFSPQEVAFCPKPDKAVFILLLIVLSAVPGPSLGAEENTKTLLIPPVEEINVMYRQFLPVKSHLEKELDLEVELVVERNYDAALEKIGQGKADLAYLDPAAYCDARHKHDVVPLAKAVRKESEGCGSVLVVRHNSPIKKIVQTKGKSLALGSVHSSSSYLMPLSMLKDVDLGLNDFSRVGYLQREDQVALSVLVGDYDLGAMSQEVARKYAEYGLRIIHCAEPIPRFVLSASRSMDNEFQSRVKRALLKYQPTGEQDLAFASVQDREYDVVRIMIKNITGRDYLHYPAGTLKLGLLPLYSAITLHEMFQPLAKYLGQELDRDVRLVIPRDFEEFVHLVRQGEVDFTFQNPYVHLLLARDGHLQPLVLTISPEPEEPRPEFRGVILTRKDSDIRQIQDLTGKKIMIVSFKSAGGYWFQNVHLRQELGVDISQAAELVEGKKHENVILALYRGEADAGFVREAVLPLAWDLVDMDKIKVLERTRYHPNWPLSAVRHVPEDLAEQAQQALLDLQGNELLREARIEGFTRPDIRGLRALEDLVQFDE
ncbi:MAG: phosphate/phosphite/phosphonate ABC transporter substrate-binding protein [Thermodesulfobacteriota bacterium]